MRVASVNDEMAIEEVFEEFGAPDVVVNNAGIVRFAPLATARIEDFRAVVDVNLVGTFIVARAAARRVDRQRTTGVHRQRHAR